MTKKIAILDLDDTLANMKVHIHRILTEFRSDTPCHTEWNVFGVERRMGISWEDIQQRIIDQDVLSQMIPHDGAVSFTHGLKNLGYDVMVMTARGWHPDAYKITSRWLQKYGFNVDELNIVPITACKSDVINKCQRARDGVLFLDDRHEHCKAVIDNTNVKNVLLFEQPWNTGIDGIKRVNNYSQIINIIGNSYETTNSRKEITSTS